MSEYAADRRDVTLLDLLDRILRKGAIVNGEVEICLCDIALVYVGLKVLICSIDKAEELRQRAADRQAGLWNELKESRLPAESKQ